MSPHNSRYQTSSNQDEFKQTEVETDLVRRSKTRHSERFLKGPILLRDIAEAARLPGKALALFLAIRHQTDLTGKPSITLPAKLLTDLGVSRGAKARGLRSLEKAGLITVVRSKGRTARIHLATITNKGGNSCGQF
jgi:DNA-binding MarR family transcriptional regulator